MSKHLAAKVIGAVSGLRGESGAVLTRELLENIVRVADFFLPSSSVHIKKMKTAEVKISARSIQMSLVVPCHLFV